MTRTAGLLCVLLFAGAYLEPIALTTGELFVTVEITRGGRAPQRHRINVTPPHVTPPQVVAGTIVSVKAVNARGLDG